MVELAKNVLAAVDILSGLILVGPYNTHVHLLAIGEDRKAGGEE